MPSPVFVFLKRIELLNLPWCVPPTNPQTSGFLLTESRPAPVIFERGRHGPLPTSWFPHKEPTSGHKEQFISVYLNFFLPFIKDGGKAL